MILERNIESVLHMGCIITLSKGGTGCPDCREYNLEGEVKLTANKLKELLLKNPELLNSKEIMSGCFPAEGNIHTECFKNSDIFSPCHDCIPRVRMLKHILTKEQQQESKDYDELIIVIKIIVAAIIIIITLQLEESNK